MSDFTTDGPVHRELKAAAVEAARRAPALDTREAVDAELRTRSDASIASMVEYDCPETILSWEKMTPTERYGWRARNEQARRLNAAARQAVASAGAAAATAGQQAASDATRAALRSQLAVPGLQGSALESAIDAVLTTRAIAGVDALLEQKRKQYGSF